MPAPFVSNEEKDRVWKAYRNGAPVRVPVTLGMNNRMYVLNPEFNTEAVDYRAIFGDAETMLRANLRAAEVMREHYHPFCDLPTGLPDAWQVGVHFQNCYEAWFYGATVEFRDGQVPDSRPPLGESNKNAVFDVDIEQPFARDPYKRGLEFTARMKDLARNMEFRGRPVEILPYVPQGSDGPMTGAMNLRGGDFLLDLVTDEAYAQKLLAFLTQAAINRAKETARLTAQEIQNLWFADDSIELISREMYVEKVLPHHRRYYDALDPARKLPRFIHLCGDARRHFPVLLAECGVKSFDTGFPFDFAAARRELGPEVEISGGVEVGLLMHGTSEQVHARTREILASGVMTGGRFVLREANNLPPAAPKENLAAMYRAALEFGRYGA